MIIRTEQMAAFRQAASRNFENRLIAFLRTNLPRCTAGMTDSELSARIAQCRDRGQPYRIQSESSIAMFTCLTFLPGTPIYEIPAVDKFLRRPLPNVNLKLIHLVRTFQMKLNALNTV